MIVDGTQEENQGLFKREVHQADCQIKRTESYSPWASVAEGAIQELKLGFGCKMVWSKAPKQLWDHCLELESSICSHVAHNIFNQRGVVPETISLGQTADISPFAEHGWYEWVKYRDQVIPFPKDKFILKRYIGPSINVGPAITAKILKANGQIIY